MPHVIDEENFPYFSFFVLLSAGFASGLALTGLFPYVAFMTVDLGAAENVDKAGYVSGYIASAFMLGRLVTSFYWGRVADKIGRKPVFYTACISTAISSLIFGFSVNLYMAIASRVFLGLMNPTVGLIKTVVSELCAPKDQTFAMSVVSASWSIGLVIGPSIGGWASRPAVQYPGSWIAGVELFQRFPYLLPNIITAVFSCISMLMIYLYLPETLNASIAVKGEYEMVSSMADDDVEGQRRASDCETAAALSGMQSCPDAEEIDLSDSVDRASSDNKIELDESNSYNSESMADALARLLKIEGVRVSLLAYFALSYIAIIYDEIVPLWALSSKSKGGLEYSSKEVGFIVSFTGIPMVLFTVFLFPPIARWLGNVQGFRLGIVSTSVFGLGVMLSPLICKYILPDGAPLLPVLLLMTSCAKMSSCMAFTCTFLLINASVPSNLRGSVNGLAMTFGSVAKALGPTIGSIVFASSIHSSIPLPVSYLLVFLINFAIAGATVMILSTKSFDTADDTPSGNK